MSGIFGNLFDLNEDGRLDCIERAMEFTMLKEIIDNDDEDSDTTNEDNDFNLKSY